MSKSLSNSMGKWHIYFGEFSLSNDKFKNNFELLAWCDILPMKVAILYLKDHGFFMKGPTRWIWEHLHTCTQWV